MNGKIQQLEALFERSRQCFAHALETPNVQEKLKLRLLGDELLQEAHRLADKCGYWAPIRDQRQ